MEQKRTKSHKYLSNAIYLIRHVNNSLQYLPNVSHQKKLLVYLTHLYQVMQNFFVTFFGHKVQENINRSPRNVPHEIQKACSLNLEIIRLTKIRLHVMLVKNAQAQETIERIFEKVQFKFQRYLISINYFNKEMLKRCNIE